MTDRLTELQDKRSADERYLSHREAQELIRLQSNEIERLTRMMNTVHPRVWKLAEKHHNFIVIGEHEPYYLTAYSLIREQEMLQGTWTEDDQFAFNCVSEEPPR